jgi:hypothetical protein
MLPSLTRRRDRHGDWFQTYTGKKFYPFDPRPEEICIEDIAHSLSMQCRFAGHCREHYSVAEHSVRGSAYLRGELALHFLLHDAAEAYLVDLPRPLKRTGVFGWLYRRVERRLELVIAEAFALPFPHSPVIKQVDARMLMTEKRDLLTDPPAAWKESESMFPPFADTIKPLTPSFAEHCFLNRYNALTAR